MFINIQFLRFFAVLQVVLFHAMPVFLESTGSTIVDGILSSGFSGVDIFFVISGFIIWYTSDNGGVSMDALLFFKRRLKRIFSGYLPFFIAATFIISIYFPKKLASIDFLGSALLLPIPISERVLPVSWSLTYELYFYLIFALILFFEARVRLRILAVLAGAIVIVNLIGYSLFDFYSKEFFSTIPLWARIPFSPYNLEFIAGALIAANMHKMKLENTLIYFGCFVLLFVGGAYYNARFAGLNMESGYYVMERVGLFGGASLFLLLAAISLEKKKILVLPGASLLLGGASYSIYLSHTLIITVISQASLPLALSEISLFIFAVSMVIAYSTFHYVRIEKPLYKYLVYGKINRIDAKTNV